MRVIAVINQKGGCGKTTVAVNLSACLAVQGRRTLLVDMDPQSHCAVGLAVPEDQIEASIYDVMISWDGESRTELKHVVWQIAQNFDLAPSSIELAALEQQLAGKDRREDYLRNVLHEYAGGYNYVVVDCSPSVGLLTFNALRAADDVLIPVETGYFSLHGLQRQLETLDVLKEQCRQDVAIHILASMYDVRTKLAREILTELRKQYNGRLLQTIVNFNTKLKEAASFGQPITEYDSSSKGMGDFQALAKEMMAFEEAHAGRSRLHQLESNLETISQSAEKLIAHSKEAIGAKPAIVQKTEKTVAEKIDNFYGVRQKHDRVEFATLCPGAKEVCVAGDFNGWDPHTARLSLNGRPGRWMVDMPLQQGRYRYRYVVDGQWQQDPYNEKIELNEFGEYNSVLEVV
ncbi:MAG: AAA family ATPase [Sedimentisphaerales bacterium]|nr:AAA family ATPase [Sedimentisphaerales bacterium]